MEIRYGRASRHRLANRRSVYCKKKGRLDIGRPRFLLLNTNSHFVTRNTALLLSVLWLVFTSTVPVVAPDGTLVSISDFDMTLYCATVPLKMTPVTPVRSVPSILTAAP